MHKYINNRYAIIKEIARGGMGIVYLIEDTMKNNMPFALKTIRQDIVNRFKDKGIISFKNEYEIMTRLKHPNLIRVFEFGEDAGNYYIIMEYLAGQVLSDMIYKDHDDSDTIHKIVQILRALNYIHSRNIIYRDIKPGNIMIHDNIVKLMDFGISGHIEDKLKKVKGTISYFAPEVLSHNISFSNDIFSLGIVFFEMISHMRFYQNDNDILCLLNNREKYSDYLEERANLINNESIRHIIRKMITYDVKERYKTCCEIIFDINKALRTNYEYETRETKYSYLLGNSFTNRKSEILKLKEYINTDKNNKLFIYSGSSGIGKTRLFAEFKKHCELNNILFFESNCIEGELSEYNSMKEIVSQLIPYSSKSLIKQFENYLKILLPCNQLLSNTSSREFIHNPEILHKLIIQNISDFLIKTAEILDKRKLIIYINDLQWIDDGSYGLLRAFLNRLSSIDKKPENLFFFANINSDRIIDNAPINKPLESHLTQQYELSPFDREGVLEFIINIFGNNFTSKDLKDSADEIIHRLGGNPLLIEEFIKSLIDREIIIRDKLKWRLLQPVASIPLPKNIIDIVKQRINTLFSNKNKKTILKTLSLLRIAIPYGLIKIIIDEISDIDAEKTILELENYEIIKTISTHNYILYTFNSSLVKDLIKDHIKDKEKRIISLFLAEILENASTSSMENYSEEIAYQYSMADKPQKAYYYYEICGDMAIDNYINDKALKYYKTALKYLKKTLNYPIDKEITIKLKIGRINETIGNWKEAENFYESSMEISENIDNKELLAKSCMHYGCLISSKGNTNKALQIFEISLEIGKELNSKSIISSSLRNIGNIHHNRGDFSKALKYLLEAQDISKKIEDKSEFEKATINIGNIYNTQSKYNEALQCFKAVSEICRELNDKFGYGKALGNIGIIYLHLCQYKKALKYFKADEKICRDIGHKQGIGKIACNIGIIYRSTGNYDMAINCYQKSYNIGKELGDKYMQINAMGNMGNTMNYQGNYKKALECLQLAKKLAYKTEDKWSISISISNMGNVYENMHEYNKALKCYEQLIKISKEIGSKQGLSIAFGNIGNIYFSLNQYKKALQYYSEKLIISEEIGYKAGIGSANCSLGNIHYAMRNYTKAKAYYEKYLNSSRDIKDKKGMADAFSNLGSLYYEINDHDKALVFLDKALELFSNMGINNEEVLDYYLIRSKIMVNKNNLIEAKASNDTAKKLAWKMGNKKYILRTKIQDNIISSDNPENSILKVFSEETDEEYHAIIYYELFLYTNKEEYRKNAIELYKKLYETSPNFKYDHILHNLQKNNSTNEFFTKPKARIHPEPL